MKIYQLILAGLLFMSAGFSLSYTIFIDGVPVGDSIVLSAGSHTAKLQVSSENLTILNYSFRVHPRNVERILQKMDIPLADSIDVPLPPDFVSDEGSIAIPDAICGAYSAFGEVYYIEDGALGREEISKSIRIPCENSKARWVYFAVSRLPWFVVNFLMDRFLPM